MFLRISFVFWLKSWMMFFVFLLNFDQDFGQFWVPLGSTFGDFLAPFWHLGAIWAGFGPALFAA